MRKLAVIAPALGLAVLAGCGSGSGTTATDSSGFSVAARANSNLDLGTSLGGRPAPGIRLDNQFGQPIALSQFRGKVVILAFADSQCTTVCPLTTQSMVMAKELLGAAGSDVQLVGVDANPRATSLADVMSYSKAHGMVSQWDFLTGSARQLRRTWSAYHIAVQIDRGQIDHTPALFVIDQLGRLQKIYLTSMAYDSVPQSAQVLALEVSSLLPGRPKLASTQSLASIPAQAPGTDVTLPSASGAGTVSLGPGSPRLVVFFASWLSQTTNLKARLLDLNAYAKRNGLPRLVAVDETATEPSAQPVRQYLPGLRYPVALDRTGRVADGYDVDDQPWLVLVNAAGTITWSHDGWVTLPALVKAAGRAA